MRDLFYYVTYTRALKRRPPMDKKNNPGNKNNPEITEDNHNNKGKNKDK